MADTESTLDPSLGPALAAVTVMMVVLVMLSRRR
jgi:hypothetical protein